MKERVSCKDFQFSNLFKKLFQFNLNGDNIAVAEGVDADTE